MGNFLHRLFVEPIERFFENLVQYLPNIMSFLLVLAAGVILGKVLKTISLRAFRLFKVDKFSERTGIEDMLHKGGIREHMSGILAQLVQWGTVFVFLIIALNVLEVPEVEHLLRTFFLYLPNVLVAMVIMFVGYLLANFLSRAALIAAVNAEIKMSGVIGKGVKFCILVLAFTMSLEQLGIGRETIIVAFTIVFGGAVFAISLAIGLGSKDLARQFIERSLKEEKQEEKKVDDIQHL
jgi:small-conductance mechanosensitive channel